MSTLKAVATNLIVWGIIFVAILLAIVAHDDRRLHSKPHVSAATSAFGHEQG